MKKIILGNLITFFILFCLLELTSYIYIKMHSQEYININNKYIEEHGGVRLTQKYAPIRLYTQDGYPYRKTNIGSSKKGSILFFGCSYTYGDLLEENETLPSIISQRTNRTTINRGISAGSILNSLHDLRNKEFYKKIPQKPDYIIYIYIYDHLARIINPYKSIITTENENAQYDIEVLFKKENGKLKEIKPNKFILPFYALYITKAWYLFYAYTLNKKSIDDKMYNLLLEAKSITDTKFENSKFVIIEYKDGSKNLISDKLRKQLLKSDFIILNAEELAGHELDSEKWRARDKEHPSGAAFKDVAIGLIKELNL